MQLFHFWKRLFEVLINNLQNGITRSIGQKRKQSEMWLDFLSPVLSQIHAKPRSATKITFKPQMKNFDYY